MIILTGREKAVLALMADGVDGHEIADRLGMSWKTYHTHREHIFKKMKIKGSNAIAIAVKYAIQKGLTRSELPVSLLQKDIGTAHETAPGRNEDSVQRVR